MNRTAPNAIDTLAVLGLLAIATVTAGCNQKTQTEIYVAPDGHCKPQATGDVNNPFRRIGDAIDEARNRQKPDLRIIVIVRPGTYVGTHSKDKAVCNPMDTSTAIEMLPLTIDISNFELRGQTVLVDENRKPLANGVPKGVSDDLTMIRIKAGDRPVEAGDAIILVRPPDGGQVNNVAINGFMLSGAPWTKETKDRDLGKGMGIFIDRTSHFSVQRNVLAGFGTGLRTRASSGLINQNVALNNITPDEVSGVGFTVSGGSRSHPANLQIFNNYATANTLGILLVGPGTYKIKPAAPKVEFDLNLPGDQNEVPDTLDAVVAGNILQSNALAGLRVFSAAQLTSTYTTKFPLFQPISTKVHLECRNNSFISNTHYGIAVDAGFPGKDELFKYQFTFLGEFEKNTFTNNGTARAFLGFQRLQAALGKEPEWNWKPLEDSVLDVRDPFDELKGFNFVHPFTLVRLNSLVVNGNAHGFGTCIGGNC